MNGEKKMLKGHLQLPRDATGEVNMVKRLLSLVAT